jgi:hypothetical protein
MPSPFRRRERLSPDFIAVPAESSVTQQLAELHSRTDAALRLIDALAAGPDPDVCDAVLEIRLVLRPAAPVVQGYVDTHADEYGKNPW